MKSRLAAACTAALFLSSLCSQVPAFAGQGPGAERKGAVPATSRGHGMMGGYGMMGGWGGTEGCGPGMMGAQYGALNLTKDQRGKIDAIHRSLRDKQIALMDRMHDSMQSTMVYRDGKFDEQAARNAYAAAQKEHQQMFENMLDAQKQMDAVLTPQQRQQLSQANR